MPNSSHYPIHKGKVMVNIELFVGQRNTKIYDWQLAFSKTCQVNQRSLCIIINTSTLNFTFARVNNKVSRLRELFKSIKHHLH